MAERTVSWKPRDENTILGTDVDRIDGVEKATGSAKYSTDVNPEGTLHARMLTSPHAHARIARLNVEPARAVDGVHGVYTFDGRQEGFELQYDGHLIAAVAAETAGQALDGLAAIEIEFEVLDHLVNEFDLARGAEMGRLKPQRTSEEGNLQEGLDAADVVHSGVYGLHTITHMCLEAHGSHCEFDSNGHLTSHLSTQNVSGTPGQYSGPLGIDAANVTVNCDYIGGGFGSKFRIGEWGVACAALARETGRPVRLHLDRATELKIAGNRPSAFATVTIAADENGKITAWDSHHWGTDGPAGGTVNQVPYVFHPANSRSQVTGIVTNCGEKQAWRAPNHPQACALTDTAIDDLAAELELDPYDVFMANLDLTQGVGDWAPELYAEEMKIGAELIGWKDQWQPRGEWGDGPVKHGLGMALHTWTGRAGGGNCNLRVNQDGTVEIFAGTQDLGTGTRTVMALVLAEAFGIPMEQVTVNIGTSRYPQCGGSGGSTTVGGISGPTQRAALAALWQIYDKVAERYNVNADSLSAADGKILLNSDEVCSWSDACSLLGRMGLETQGAGPADDGLTGQQVGGVQMVHVAVDTETGVTDIVKYVAVQDMGTIINPRGAESQILGSMIMCIAYALSEERIMDGSTGRFINANLRDYKLPRIGDIGELVVELYQPDSQYNRGVVGLGEPPVISGGAAIANAVANAIGVRVPVLPLTPKRVLDALRA